VAWKPSDREQADLFLADLLGGPTPVDPAEADSEFVFSARWTGQGREPFFADATDERWKVVGRPGRRTTDEFRDDDLVVYRSRAFSGLTWRCYLVADVGREKLFHDETDRLRSDLVVIRRVLVRSGPVPHLQLPRGATDANQSPEDQPPTSATTQACAADVAVNDTMALLIASKAPLPVAKNEIARAVANSGVRDDYHAVAAVVPAVAEPRLLVVFHGNNNYVTVAPKGDVPPRVDPTQHSRVPRWVSATGRKHIIGDPAVKGMDGVKAAPIKYGFNSLAASQRALSPEESFKNLDVKDPVVLIPEDAEPGSKWAVPPKGQYGTSTKLQDLVIECYEHLRCLRNPAGRPYLPADMSQRASWVSNIRRTYMSGHSGGGKPLVETAAADMVLVTPSSVAGVGGRAVEFWLFDCTYGFGTKNYVNFCVNWLDNKLLAYGADSARFVCVYRAKDSISDTETEANQLRGEIAKALKVSPGSLLKLHDSAKMSSPSMINTVIPALISRPVVFIRTQVAHDMIPTLFTPLLLRTAAS
jgi:hypothetical protein